MTEMTSVLRGYSHRLNPALHFMPCGKIIGKDYFSLSLPTKPDISFHQTFLLVLTSGLYKFKAPFSISALLKVTVFDKSYSPGCQIKLTWAMMGEQKNKEAKFYSLVFRKWDKINPSEGSVLALTDQFARGVSGNTTQMQKLCWLAPPRWAGLIRPSHSYKQLLLLSAPRLKQKFFLLYNRLKF